MKCIYCGEEFTPRTPSNSQDFCSRECHNEFYWRKYNGLSTVHPKFQAMWREWKADFIARKARGEVA